jgi:glycosyltransferase involved in cell wall biosynthesis
VGRVEPHKGHHLAARIASALHRTLKVVGPTTDKRYADALASTSDVELIGSAKRDVVLDLINNAEALLWLPTIAEPYGRVIIEAVKLNTLVIARPFGVVSDLIEAGVAHTAHTDIERSFSGVGDMIYLHSVSDLLESSPEQAAKSHWDLYMAMERR